MRTRYDMRGANNPNWTGGKAEYWCNQCGKKFTRYESTIRGKYVFCSRSCHDRWRAENTPRGKASPYSKRVSLKCEICGKEFERPLWVAKRSLHHYCSRECLSKRKREKAANWQGGKVTRVCEICGTEFKVIPALVRKSYGRFCSQQCATTDRLRKLAAERPNKSEVALAKIIERNRLPYRYTGDGSVWIGGRNPDFINVNGKKQLIELFGEHWHPIFDVAEKVNLYKEYGFDCLIIWEEELKDEEKLVKKLKKFARKRKVRS